MENRLEVLRSEIDKLIMETQPEKDKFCYTRLFVSHLYGVSHFCALLAVRRKLNVELAVTCGMLHDIYSLTHDSSKNHAVKGSEQAKSLLISLNLYTDEEIDLITAAVSRHSDKDSIHEPYDELLKDADVLSHCFYNPDFAPDSWEVERYKKLLAELRCNRAE